MKYRVIRDCVGFQGKRWRKGQIVDVTNGVKPPHHFEVFAESPSASVDEKAKEIPLSTVMRPAKMPNGFAVNVDTAPQKVKTAAEAASAQEKAGKTAPGKEKE